MTPEQLAALETLAGRTIDAAEQAQLDPYLLPDNRNDVAIAGLLNANAPDLNISIKVEDVFDVLFFSGDYLGLKQAQLSGNAQAAMAFAVLQDAKTIGPGTVNLNAPATVLLFDALQNDGLLSSVGRAALVAKSKRRPDAIPFQRVSDALNLAEGRMVP